MFKSFVWFLNFYTFERVFIFYRRRLWSLILTETGYGPRPPGLLHQCLHDSAVSADRSRSSVLSPAPGRGERVIELRHVGHDGQRVGVVVVNDVVRVQQGRDGQLFRGNIECKFAVPVTIIISE